jgi:L-ribulokinase
MEEKYVIGLDFGTDSVRAIIVNAGTGEEEAGSVSYYPRWADGKYCRSDHNQFRQHPLDYLESMEEAIKGALKNHKRDIAGEVIAIGVDTTGSTPCPVDKEGIPLAMREEFKDNPNAMFILWKDHTAVREAEEINKLAKTWDGEDFTKYEGGVYSSEWFWAKILHILREDNKVKEAAFSWVEHCDWITATLSGETDPLIIKRSRCAAGHKAMWHQDWGGLPDEEFLVRLDPLLKGIKNRLYTETYTSDQKAGDLSPEWAEKLGLNEGIAITVGAFDAHMGAVGGEIREKTLVKIMGTSTCDVIIAPYDVIGDKLIEGICGQVDGSVVPGTIGLEAGQSAFGDVYAWFKNLLSWPLDSILTSRKEINSSVVEEIKDQILIKLTEEAEKLTIEETGLLALDWLNGRRTPFADQTLKGVIIGLTLGTTAAKIFRSLVEATAFGARAINEQFIKEGVEIDQLIAIGGISQKNDFVMQITADVLNKPIKVATSEQTCALGAAMFGAVAAGLYSNIQEAQNKMGSGFSRTYKPDQEQAKRYDQLYQQYINLGEKLEEELRKL